MPRLSSYVGTRAEAGAGAAPDLASQLSRLDLERAGAASAGRPPGEEQEAAAAPAAEELDRAGARLQAAYEKRLRDHGPRTFRWPDGSLRPERPPASALSASNRARWRGVVRHCRAGAVAAAPPGPAATALALRYGLSVPPAAHAAHVARAGLEPEAAADGAGEAPERPFLDPLADPAHALNSFYKAAGDAVMAGARGRLL